jgi:hypothetical protein
MIGVMFVFLLAIFGFFGYVEGMKAWKKYLKDRLQAVKDAETSIFANIAKNASMAAGMSPEKMSDAEFSQYLEKNFINWGRTKGLIR